MSKNQLDDCKMCVGDWSWVTSRKGRTEYLSLCREVGAAQLKQIRSPEDAGDLDLCFSKKLLVWMRFGDRKNTNWMAN